MGCNTFRNVSRFPPCIHYVKEPSKLGMPEVLKLRFQCLPGRGYRERAIALHKHYSDYNKMETPIQQIVNHYLETKGFEFEDIQQECKEDKTFYPRHLRNAKDLLVLAGGIEEAKMAITEIAEWADGNGLDYNIGTVIKRWLERKNYERNKKTKVEQPQNL